MNICVYGAAKAFYSFLNHKREKEWNAMTEEVSITIQDLGRPTTR